MTGDFDRTLAGHGDGTILARRRLDLSADCFDPATLVMVEAPAGYGKTTLLYRWSEQARSLGLTPVWISLTAEDDDPVRLTWTWWDALQRAGVSVPEYAVPAALRSQLRFPTLIADIETDAGVSGRPILIFDDCHLLTTAGDWAPFAHIVRSALDIGPVVLSSRGPVSVPILGEMSSTRVFVFDQSALRFDDSEAEALLSNGLASDEAAEINAYVGGWPLGLRLAERVVGLGGNMASLARLRGTTTELSLFLRDQLLLALSPKLRQIVLEVAHLEPFSAELISSVCAVEDGFNVIGELRMQNLFITAVAPGEDWFKFHPVLSDFLQVYGRSTGMVNVEQVRLRGANWFRARGLLDRAVRLLLAAGRNDEAAEAVEAAGGFQVRLGPQHSVFRLLDDLPDDLIKNYPKLRLGQIYTWAQCRDADRATLALNAFRRRPVTERRKEDQDELRIMASFCEATISVYKGEPIASQLESDLQAIQSGQIPASKLFRASATSLLVCIQFDLGRFEQVHQLAETLCTAGGPEELGGPWFYVCLYKGLAEQALGRVPAAHASLDLTIRASEHHYGAHNEIAQIARLVRADLYRASGDWHAALAVIQEVGPVIELGLGWFDVQAKHAQCAIALIAASDGLQAAAQRSSRMISASLLHGHRSLAKIIALERAALGFEKSEHESQLIEEDQSGRGQLHAAVLFARLRCALAQDCAREAQGMSVSNVTWADQYCSLEMQIHARLLSQRTSRLNGVSTLAKRMLNDALALASRSGIIAPFIVEAEWLLPILRRLANRPDVAEQRLIERCIDAMERKGGLVAPPYDSRASAQTLTKREQTVLKCLADGYTSKELASLLGISVETANIHRKNIYRKLRVVGRARAISRGRELSLI